MPYICLTRTDIPEGVLQVLDLLPNTSQRNLIYDPPGQTKYLRRLDNDIVTVSSNVTAAAYKGLTAYILDAVANGTSSNALTTTQARSMATALVAILNAGTALTSTTINAALAGVVGSTGIAASGSVATVADILKIMAGGEYIVPAGTGANSGATFKGSKAGAFTAGTFRHTYDGFALAASLGAGSLAALSASTFEYGGTTGRAVVVYSDTGALM